MTTAKPTANTTRPSDGFRFPDPPEHQPDDMTSFNHLTITGSAHYLLEHFGNRETTLVAGEHYVSREPVRSPAGLHTQTCWSPLEWTRRLTTDATRTSSQSRGSRRTSYSR